jgi:hypothetical protein
MATVDLAFGSVLRRNRIRARARYFQLYSMAQHLSRLDDRRQSRALFRHAMPFAYQSLVKGAGDAHRSEVLVFWGDYMHARAYVHNVADILCDARLELSRADALARVYTALFIDGCDDDVLARTVTAGETLLSNSGTHDGDRRYADCARRFYGRAAGVSMRDAYSALRVMRWRGDEEIPLGADCALLVSEDEIDALPRSAWTDRHALAAGAVMGVFVGRTNGAAGPIGTLVADVCLALGFSAEWLPWLDSTVPPRKRDEVSASCPVMRVPDEWDTPPTLGDVLGRLARYRCVVTDTYHLCVNAWRIGIPAVCIGEALIPPGTCDVSAGPAGAWCDKRHVFYAMHEATDYYVFREELADERSYGATVRRIVRLIEDNVGVDVVRCHIAANVARAERRFLRHIAAALDAS